jgi:site-specific DNA-methyltransferase (adenine-specific)
VIVVNLQCGDCLELLKKIPTESIDLIVTDPPYKIVSGGCTTKKNATSGILNRNKREVKTGKLFSNNDISFSEWLPEVFRVLKQNTHCYIMINGRNLSELHQESKKVGFEYQNLLVWDKGNVTPNKWYMNQCEFILMLRKGKARNINNMGTSTLLQYKNIIGKKLHPTEKPVELMMLMIENSSFTGDTVLDPFMGAGSTGVACAITNRNFVGIELDKQYFDIAVKQIAENDRAVISDVC